jgi:epoxyqueuosine reductase
MSHTAWHSLPEAANPLDALQEMLLARGAARVGYGDLSAIPAEAREGLPTGVSIAVALDPQVMAELTTGPTRPYYELYNRVNAQLTALAEAGAAFLEARGHHAVSLAATHVGIDWTTLSTRLPHKTVATRAGIGWIGKCALVVTREFGSALRLATVLTDAPLPTARPINTSRCGDCMGCVRACPAHAPLGENWHAGLAREAFYDAQACCTMAKSLSEKAGIDDIICGLCIVACPWTRRYLERAGVAT